MASDDADTCAFIATPRKRGSQWCRRWLGKRRTAGAIFALELQPSVL
jgi:hypothetical protein